MVRILTKAFLLSAFLTILPMSAFGYPKQLFADDIFVFDKFGDVQCENYLARMDNAIIAAQNNPESNLFVFVYEGKLTRYRYDRNGQATQYFVQPPVGTAQARIRSMQAYLKLRGDPKNFIFVEGGTDDEFMVRLYLVPKGVDPPRAVTAAKKIKYAKGKAKGFCLGCCGP